MENRRITIVVTDNIVLVDGKAHQVDCSAIDGGVQVIQWHGARGGEIEFIQQGEGFRLNTSLNTMEPYAVEIAAWDAAEQAEQNPPPEAPTAALVNAERDRRVGEIFEVNVSGIGFFPIDMTPQSRANVQGLVTLAILNQQSPDPIVTFRDANNIDHGLTPAQVIQMGVQVAQHIDAIYKASWAVKNGGDIPANFRDDTYWP